jgi:ferredoxin like protein
MKPEVKAKNAAAAGAMSLEDKLFLVKTKKDSVSHIKLNKDICSECEKKVCLFICPSGTYEEIDGEVEAAYENCLECGSCRVACENGAIAWKNPRGGFGVTYVNG